jgi:hypothetical protein
MNRRSDFGVFGPGLASESWPAPRVQQDRYESTPRIDTIRRAQAIKKPRLVSYHQAGARCISKSYEQPSTAYCLPLTENGPGWTRVEGAVRRLHTELRAARRGVSFHHRPHAYQAPPGRQPALVGAVTAHFLSELSPTIYQGYQRDGRQRSIQWRRCWCSRAWSSWRSTPHLLLLLRLVGTAKTQAAGAAANV